ncbi:hypothetical protein NODU109028_01200 [Nocardioides dubius]|uniref:Uncharacterized protein n=1 Tax=Nocardioides dubius TaxID=317019 RepID=A0ABN1TTP7_9ACTN
MSTDDRYTRFTALAELFDATADQLRERATLGATVLGDDDVADSAELSPRTFAQAEEEILAATTGKHGLLGRSTEFDADALIVRATVRTYRWIDDLQDAAYRTLGSIAARAVGYLAPEVELGGAIVAAGLIETDALDRDGLAAYLNELAEANPDLMEHFVSGGGGLVESLQLRALLTNAALGAEHGSAITRGGLRAVGAPDFADDFSSALRDVAGGLVAVDAEASKAAVPSAAAQPSSVEEIVATLASLEADLWVQSLPGGRFALYLTGAPSGSSTDRVVLADGDVATRVERAAQALRTAIGSTSGARVLLAGSGHGGVVATALASLPSDAWVVDQVITAGSPAAQATAVPPSVPVLALEDRSDPVALLGSLLNAGVTNRLTVVFDGGSATGVRAYLAGGRAVDTSTHDDLRAAVQRLRELGYLR